MNRPNMSRIIKKIELLYAMKDRPFNELWEYQGIIDEIQALYTMAHQDLSVIQQQVEFEQSELWRKNYRG